MKSVEFQGAETVQLSCSLEPGAPQSQQQVQPQLWGSLHCTRHSS